MALLDWITPESGLSLEGQGIRLCSPRWRDYSSWASLRGQSRHFLQPWEPTWPEDDLDRASYRRRMATYAREIDTGGAYPFFIFRISDDALMGGVTLSNVRRGVAQMATVGYWMGEPYAGQGFMTAALKPLTAFAFGALGLHRVEAACLPDNHASHRLLLKTGFRQEGMAQAYLKINGIWRDHLLFGMVTPNTPVDLDV